jgi:autotransporter-associated beta strand protein
MPLGLEQVAARTGVGRQKHLGGFMTKSRFSKKSMLALGAAVCCAPGLALAVQTYTDAIGDYAGGSATAPPPGDSYEDIASVVITNDATNIFFQINLAASDGGHATNITTDTTQSYGKYQIGLETVPGAGNTAVSNPYNPIGISTGMNYWLDNWTNQTTGGTVASPDTGDGQVFNYSGGAWTQIGGNGLATDVAGNPQFTQTTLGMTSVTMSVSLALLNLSVGNQFNFDAWTTFDGGDGAVDALDSGAAATSESSSTYVNPYAPTPYDSATAPGSTYSTTIYSVAVPTFTWNDSTAASGFADGTTWDIGDTNQYNWNNGIFADYYTDNINVVFNDTNNGNYAVTLNTTVHPNSVVVNNSAGNYTISGTGSIAGTGSLTKSGSSMLTLSTVNTYSGGTTVSAGTLVAAVHGALPDGSLAITGGKVLLAPNTGAQQLTSLSISSGGLLDIANNHFILTYAAGTQTAADASILNYLTSGRNGGAWNGTTGIVSSGSSGSGIASGYSIGYADGADHVVAGLSSGQIEVKYTLLGDANLDGLVSGDDFTILVGNLGKSGIFQWDKGNFLYNSLGLITGDDFTVLVANLGKNATGGDVELPASDYAAIDAYAAANGLMADVPEPATMGVLAISGIGLLARRRRKF